MNSRLVIAATLCAVLIPILWSLLSAAMSDPVRACLACLALIVGCGWGLMLFGGNKLWLIVNMGVGMLLGLACRYPRHGGESHRANVPLYQDLFFCAGAFAVLTDFCKAFFI